MKMMKQKHFWMYAGFGCLGLMLSAFVLWVVDIERATLKPHPDYVAFQHKLETYNKQDAARRPLYLQRMFEEALLGKRTPEEVTVPELREVAKAALALKDGNRFDRPQWLNNLFIHREDRKRVMEWTAQDSFRDWEFAGPLSSLNSIDRLDDLLRGKPDHVFASLPEVPKTIDQPPTYPEGAPKTIDAGALGTSNIIVWCVVSACFALAFCIAGLVGFHAPQEYISQSELARMSWGGGKVPPMSHPTGSHPDFLLGWIVKLAFLPGFLAAHLLHALLVDFRPYAKAAHDRMFPKEFANAYARFELQLETIKARAETTGRKELLAGIDEMLAKVREANDRDQLKKLSRTLEGVRYLMDAQDQLDTAYTADQTA